VVLEYCNFREHDRCEYCAHSHTCMAGFIVMNDALHTHVFSFHPRRRTHMCNSICMSFLLCFRTHLCTHTSTVDDKMHPRMNPHNA
jgi:hypothetical protein